MIELRPSVRENEKRLRAWSLVDVVLNPIPSLTNRENFGLGLFFCKTRLIIQQRALGRIQ